MLFGIDGYAIILGRNVFARVMFFDALVVGPYQISISELSFALIAIEFHTQHKRYLCVFCCQNGKWETILALNGSVTSFRQFPLLHVFSFWTASSPNHNKHSIQCEQESKHKVNSTHKNAERKKNRKLIIMEAKVNII